MTSTSLREYRLDRNTEQPLWLQLSNALRTAIADDVLRPDQALPSEAELIDMYGVSRTVVREALAELVRRGLIYKIRAKGSFVSPPRRDLSFIGSTAGSLADLTAAGRNSSTQVLGQSEGEANEREAEALQISVGAPVARLKRLRSVDGSPWLLVETTLPLELFPGIAKANLENRSLYDHIRRHYGTEVAGADRWIQAVMPSASDAELLQLAKGEPALAIESIAWDSSETRFEYYQALHRSGSSRFYVGIR
ncbi:GntR family transcriptional regulator [Paramicrobacterium humi]|uniref:GntR family transcriptional regulator n=1 Tax=Paramicrobacterium humi TaxID=640635 RepID=A0A1H4KXD2_9MICO|nr:GntR family transcriptional regulator [Microbacterium humi]SEB63157.1 GntR family transcriptional regulator [Microbacterium humi]